MKQRLVGAVILGCLAIIFIPILLDGEGLSAPELDLDMPVAPAIPAIPQIAPLTRSSSHTPQSDIELAEAHAAPELLEEGSSSVEPSEQAELSSQQMNEPNVEQGQVESAALSPEGIPQAWSVRLAAFGDQENAEALEADLLEKDYKAYSRPIVSSQGSLVAVYVGPVLTRSEAGGLAEMLKDEFELEGVVVEFRIDN